LQQLKSDPQPEGDSAKYEISFNQHSGKQKKGLNYQALFANKTQSD